MNTDIPAADTQPSAPPPDTRMPPETADAIRRYMRLQLDIFLLEQEKDRLRDSLVRELGTNVPGIWHPVLDGKPLTVMHSYRTTVRYDEQTLRERLGGKYREVLEPDGNKIRRNRDLVRPLLSDVLETIGSVNAARVESAIRNGVVPAESFQGAYRKTLTPFLSIRIDK